MATNNPLKTLLLDVLSQPTAPFRETWVKRACQVACAKRKIGVHEDRVGNLWLNCAPAKPPSLLFVAHLDHPGFIIRGFEKRGKRIIARALWLGGGPTHIAGCRVKIFGDAHSLVTLDGKVLRHEVGPRGPSEAELEILDGAVARTVCNPSGFKALGLWGACLVYPGLEKGVKQSNGHWVTKAADDLAGACTLIEALGNAKKPKGVGVLLTRAEESGFHGAVDVLRSGVLNPRNTIMISVETSAERPNATLGKGPILRAGDIASVFDPGITGWMQECAGLIKSKPFHLQRQLMDGGACEATAFGAFGFRAAGLSLPLRNYHNITASQRPKAEEIDSGDAQNLVQFLTVLMRSHRKTHLKPGALTRIAFAARSKRIRDSYLTHRRYFSGE